MAGLSADVSVACICGISGWISRTSLLRLIFIPGSIRNDIVIYINIQLRAGGKVLGAMCLVLGSWCFTLLDRLEVTQAWFLVPSSRFWVLSS